MAIQITRKALPPSAYENVDGVLFPCIEEEPLVQGDWHDAAVFDVKGMVKAHLADRPGVHVGSDTFVFWDRTDPDKKVAPDLFVCPVVAPRSSERKSFKVFQELSGPRFVLEVLSDSTDKADWGGKFRVYAEELSVVEYFLFEPREVPGQVWGFRLREGQYQPISPNARGRIWSEEVELWFGVDEHGAIQTWTEEGRALLRPLEAMRRAEEEMRRANALEARVRALEAELERRGRQGSPD